MTRHHVLACFALVSLASLGALPQAAMVGAAGLGFAAASGGPPPVVEVDTHHDLTPPLAEMVGRETVAAAAQEDEDQRRQLPGRHPPGPGSASIAAVPATRALDYSTISPPLRNFDGVSNADNYPRAPVPPDTNGDVGPNHYVQWVNVSFKIWNKQGTLLLGPARGNTLWAGFGGACETTNNGDPVAVYDGLADRWVMSQFALPSYPSAPFYQCVAVSRTADPTGQWYRYAFLIPSGKMNDYPKLAVWPDAYYLSMNQFAPNGGGWAGAGAAALERDKMLAGEAARMVFFDLDTANHSFGGMLPSHLTGPVPPEGSPNYYMEVDDAAWGSFDTDSLRLWQFHADWTNPISSTFGIDLGSAHNQPNAVLDTEPFSTNLWSIPQPGTDVELDSLVDQLMYRLQYRNFGDHEALVANHTVNVGGHAGIRWYEVRDPSGDPIIYQQGTFSPDANNRWMGSIAMDGQGNVALGYSISSSSMYPSVRYAGRLASDPLGTMPRGEGELVAGSGAQTSSTSRWGDYSSMSVDPTDDLTFWYTQEYYASTSERGWRTRIGSFDFASTLPYSTTVPLLSRNTIENYASGGGTATISSVWDALKALAGWLGI